MRRLFPLFPLVLLWFMSGCALEMPVVTPAPVVLATPVPTSSPPLASNPTATPQPTTPPAITPSPTLPATATPVRFTQPTVEETLRAGLTYLQAGFKLKMPPPEAFTPGEPPTDLEGVRIEQALHAAGWTVVISPIEALSPERGYRTIIFSKDTGRQVMRWWGQVDDQGLASTVVFTGMPRPKSTRVKGITGKVVQLPPGSAYPRYFEDMKGRRYGIATNKEAIRPLLERLTEADGRVQFWGELRYAVNDVNGRRILVRKYNLLDVSPEEVLARTPRGADRSDGGAEGEIGIAPYAIIDAPLPHTVIHAQVQVRGEVGGLTDNQVILRVELADGRVLGEVTVPLIATGAGSATFSATVPFINPAVLSEGRIAVYAPAGDEDALLGWTVVRFAGDVGDKRVVIQQPEAGAGIRGQVLVTGRAENISAGPFLVRVEDVAGTVYGKARAKLRADGFWQVQITFRRPKTARSGVIAVYQPTPDGLILLAQQPVRLKR